MSVIRWADNVNQRVIDQTTITIGESGFVDNESDSKNFSERHLTSIAVPDTYNVVMDFDWAEKDENGNSEFDRFVNWYKYVHKRGVNPFEFPAITDFTVNGSKKICQYKITSALTPQKSGFCMRVSMTWQEVFAGGFTIPERTGVLERIDVNKNGLIEAQYTTAEIPSNVLTFNDTKVFYKEETARDFEELSIDKIKVQGKMAFIYVDEIETSGDYNVKLYDGRTAKETIFRVGA